MKLHRASSARSAAYPAPSGPSPSLREVARNMIFASLPGSEEFYREKVGTPQDPSLRNMALFDALHTFTVQEIERSVDEWAPGQPSASHRRNVRHLVLSSLNGWSARLLNGTRAPSSQGNKLSSDVPLADLKEQVSSAIGTAAKETKIMEQLKRADRKAADVGKFFKKGAVVKARGEAPRVRPFFRAAAAVALVAGLSAVAFTGGHLHAQGDLTLTGDPNESGVQAVMNNAQNLAQDAFSAGKVAVEDLADTVYSLYSNNAALANEDEAILPGAGPKKPDNLGAHLAPESAVSSQKGSFQIRPPLPQMKPLAASGSEPERGGLDLADNFVSPTAHFLDRARQHMTMLSGNPEVATESIALAHRMSEQLEEGQELISRPIPGSDVGSIVWSPYKDGTYALNGVDGTPYYMIQGGEVIVDHSPNPNAELDRAIERSGPGMSL